MLSNLKPIFHNNANAFALGPCVGLKPLKVMPGMLGLGLSWPCRFHVVCVNFVCIGYLT